LPPILLLLLLLQLMYLRYAREDWRESTSVRHEPVLTNACSNINIYWHALASDKRLLRPASMKFFLPRELSWNAHADELADRTANGNDATALTAQL